MADTLISAGIAFGISYGAYRLLSSSQDSGGSGAPDPFDDSPVSTAKRGSFIPYLIGHKRLGASILWAGDRTSQQEVIGASSSSSGGGGKGRGKSRSSSSQQSQTVYFESAWHGLCLGTGGAAVGEGAKLHKIYRAGKVVFDTTITQASDPSGSSFTTDDGHEFTIYWGERSQPVNTFLGDSSRVGISSRWPNLLYVVWEGVKLGPSPVWPVFEYVVEVPCETGGTGNHVCNVPGNFYAFGSYYYTDSDPALNGGYEEWNGAHVLDQLLFSAWPQGLGLDPDEFELLSLEHLGEVIDAEELYTSLLSLRGNTAKSLIEALMQDLGFMVTWEIQDNAASPAPVTDLSGWTIRPIRDPSAGPTPPTVPSDLIAQQQVPEIEIRHGERATTLTVWQYKDRERNHAEMTLAIDEDGDSGLLDHAKASRVRVPTVNTFSQASKIAERRSQEALAASTLHTIYGLRSLRYLTPGRPFFVDSIETLLRVDEIEIEQNSGQVKIKAVEDFYGLELSTYVPPSSGTTPRSAPAAAADLAIQFLEIPAELTPLGQVSVAKLRIRANSDQTLANLHISRGGSTYTQADTDKGIVTGGALLQSLSASDSWELDQGPTFTALGPDIASVQDLSTNTEQWRLGRQLAMINGEIFFLQKITPISGSTYRLDGLLRARYNTRREAHSISDTVFIFLDSELTRVLDPLVQPVEDLYIKAQPVAAGGALSLGSVTAVSKLPVYGLGVVPEPPVNLRTTAPVPCNPVYHTGDDITVVWDWFTQAPGSAYSGAGLCNAGTPAGVGTLLGEFFLQIENSAGTVVGRTEVLNTNSYTYTNANLVADFGSEIDVRFRVVHRIGGWVSDPSTTLLVEIT